VAARGHCGGSGDHREVRGLVRLRQGAYRTGPREREAVSEGSSRPRGRSRGQGQGAPRREARPGRRRRGGRLPRGVTTPCRSSRASPPIHASRATGWSKWTGGDLRHSPEQYAAVRAARGRGPARLVKDLRAQGVDARVAEESVRRALEAEGLTPEIEARAVAARRARQLGDLPPVVRKRRLLAFLARRGYSGAAALEVVQELLER